MLAKVRCVCGRLLGKVNGKFDFRCHTCKRIVRGRTLTSDGVEIAIIDYIELPDKLIEV